MKGEGTAPMTGLVPLIPLFYQKKPKKKNTKTLFFISLVLHQFSQSPNLHFFFEVSIEMVTSMSALTPA